MNRFLCALLLLAPVRAAENLDWMTPLEPFQLADNLYCVGSRDLASYLVTTPEGKILINANLRTSPPLIRASVEKLGFAWKDTKIFLNSQAYWDHVAGAARVLRETHAQNVVMDRPGRLPEALSRQAEGIRCRAGASEGPLAARRQQGEMTELYFLALTLLGPLPYWPDHHAARECVVYSDQSAFTKAWIADGGSASGVPTLVDWKKEMVVAAFAGQKPTGGHKLEVRTVAIPSGESKLWDLFVIYHETAPQGMATQALTYPSQVVRVKRVAATGKVYFLAEGSKEANKVLQHLKK